MKSTIRNGVFISFSKVDDDANLGWITGFKDILQKELNSQSGTEVPVFFYPQSVRTGQEWHQSILSTISHQTICLIAFITPSYVKSVYCREEFEGMLRVEESIGLRDRLIMPIYFTGEGALASQTDSVISEAVRRTYADWRPLRFDDPSASTARKIISELASNILKIEVASSKGPDYAENLPTLVARKFTATPVELTSAENDDVFMRQESHYDDAYLQTTKFVLGEGDGSAVVLDLDCRDAREALRHLDLLGAKVSHLFVYANTEEARRRLEAGCPKGKPVSFFSFPKGDDFAENLIAYWRSNGYPKVDLIYSDRNYRYFSNQEIAFFKIRRDVLHEGGGVVFKCFDDGTKTMYPDEDHVLEDIISRTSGLVTVSDRFWGRKALSILKHAGFGDVTTNYVVNDTASLDIEGRVQLFEESFLYRLGYFERAAGNGYEQDEAYNTMKRQLLKLRTLFCRDDVYYCESNLFIGARK